MRKVGLPENTKGKLFLHSMPGTEESWFDFVSQLHEKRIEHIISLTPFNEIEKMSPDYANAIKKRTLSINRIELPIKDYGIPKDFDNFKQYIKKIAESLIKGENILMHCLGGIGRTGLTACCILQTLGLDQSDASERVKRSGSGAETLEQHNFIANFS